ncbi:MAG: hypothetical protein IKN96_07720 [Oscillibacter sp.]|nr:hypothetical protein [Oscillibacter sp.]
METSINSKTMETQSYSKEKEHNAYIQYKTEVGEYEKQKFWNIISAILYGFLGGFIFSGLLQIFMIAFFAFLGSDKVTTDILSAFIFRSRRDGIIIGICIAIISLYQRELKISAKKHFISAYEFSHAQDKAEDDPFQNSIKTSYKYLDRYYDETQKQAQQGFRITVFIAVCGALLIFGGVAAMYLGFVQPAYITCASGAVTELIAAIFFYLYNKTVTSMSRYHNKLVLSQNISFALRVADSLSEEKKDDAKLAIISELVKDVNAQMMKSDGDADGTPEKGKPPASDAETPSG